MADSLMDEDVASRICAGHGGSHWPQVALTT